MTRDQLDDNLTPNQCRAFFEDSPPSPFRAALDRNHAEAAPCPRGGNVQHSPGAGGCHVANCLLCVPHNVESRARP